MKRPDGWIVASGILIAIAALLVTLTFSNRAYLIERTISILLDREVHIEEVVDLELGSLISATLRGVRMDHSEVRFQAESLLVEMNFYEWLSREEINLTRLLVSNAELQLKPTGSEPDATPTDSNSVRLQEPDPELYRRRPGLASAYRFLHWTELLECQHCRPELQRRAQQSTLHGSRTLRPAG
ncbi:MAG: hypothetical protein O3C68_01810 [Proteobacteria bacterium]|nr:hypothetical protein [Pseudomonadota bacterium]